MNSSRRSFIDKLRDQLKNPETLRRIKQNQGSRLFDNLPQEFDSIFDGANEDVKELGRVLKQIRSVNTELTDKGPIFTREADKASIKIWAKKIIVRACLELLTDKNDAKSELLELVHQTKQSLSGRDTACAYFSIASQHVITQLIDSPDAGIIMKDVFNAFIQCMNQYPEWVGEILTDRIVSPRQSRYASSYQTNDDSNFDLKLGGALALGFLLVGGVAAGAAAYSARQHRNNNNNTDHSSSDDEEVNYSSPSVTHDWYKF